MSNRDRRENGKGKRKGSQFERDVCRILTEWVTGKKDPVIFWRTAGSGSQFTVKKGKSPMCGDIIAIDPAGTPFTDYFCVECKSRKKIFATSLLVEDVRSFREWWEGLVESSEKACKGPLLIFRASHHPIYVLMRDLEFYELVDWAGVPERYFIVELPWVRGALMSLVRFLDWVDIEVFRAIGEERRRS